MAYTRLLGVLLAACAACASSHESRGEPLSEPDYRAAYEAAEVDLVERCCVQAGALGVGEQYADNVREFLRRLAPREGAEARYDADAAAECIAEIEDSACVLGKELSPGADACGRVYRRGDAQLGEDCETSYDCAEIDGATTSCEVVEVTRDGLRRGCARLVQRGEGESCAGGGAQNTAVVCALPLFCDEERSICVRRPERGEPCMTGPVWGDTCAVGSLCDSRGSETCIEPLAVGSDCDSPDQCEGSACYGGKCREPLFWAGNSTCTW